MGTVYGGSTKLLINVLYDWGYFFSMGLIFWPFLLVCSFSVFICFYTLKFVRFCVKNINIDLTLIHDNNIIIGSMVNASHLCQPSAFVTSSSVLPSTFFSVLSSQSSSPSSPSLSSPLQPSSSPPFSSSSPPPSSSPSSPPPSSPMARAHFRLGNTYNNKVWQGKMSTKKSTKSIIIRCIINWVLSGRVAY